jgi:hypothetical protein
LFQAHAFSIFEVNGWDDEHGGASAAWDGSESRRLGG